MTVWFGGADFEGRWDGGVERDGLVQVGLGALGDEGGGWRGVGEGGGEGRRLVFVGHCGEWEAQQ